MADGPFQYKAVWSLGGEKKGERWNIGEAPDTPRVLCSWPREHLEIKYRCRYSTGSAGCLRQDGSPVTAYLSHLTTCYVGVRGRGAAAAVASTYKVLGEAPSASVGGPALLLLRVAFRGVVSTLSDALVTTSTAGFPLAVTLVVLRVISAAGRAPSPGEAPIAIPLGSVLASLDCNTSRAGDIRRLSSLGAVGKLAGCFAVACQTAHFSDWWCLRPLTFSPSTTSNSTVSPSPTLRRYFLGLFFLIAV